MNKDLDIMQALSEKELMILDLETSREYKSTGITYLLYFLLGTVGGHKFYLKQYLLGVLYLSITIFIIPVFFFSAMINDSASVLFLLLPMFLGLALLVDLITIPYQVRKHNEKIKNRALSRILSIRRTS
ncbi:MAG: TM2 domain-containing protein [Firmicutes bacterium]|nr:TM2 domain-containing protein [Bacillota bacterium]MDD4263087.1 TM2 domain-containing protein [Bacillota bacterium]MDD4693814.1 TM2 domain-containing protein [Bacillota bacterium]